ncbi:MAG: serine protease [Treponema sp.]|jgi:serine protease Do|nr:serine protease [Treponema sp.]
MKRSVVLFFILVSAGCAVFAQTQAPSAGALRDYVGLINQTYHPDIVSYFEKVKAELAEDGESDAVKAIDLFLKGATGSGFIVSDGAGQNYVITNHHVIAQAYSLSVTFERQDGFKKTYDGLKVIADDEESDLAILAFAPGDKPVDTGLAFLSRPVEEGEDVFSAGFPGMGTTTIWQFGRGMVSNASVRFPKSFDDDTLMGPFIQHTAQVDPGNSGGPLLVQERNVPAGYAVAGINTLSALWRQAANYAVPANTTRQFVDSALNPNPESFRAALDARLAKFAEGLGGNKAVYPHIAGFLSAACIGENAEYATSELFEKAPRTVLQSFADKFEDSVVGAMGYAVAWTIENNIRGQGAIKAVISNVSGASEEYEVVFTINGKDVSSKWVREYGVWRIRTFGEIAAGNKNLVAEKEAKREQSARLRTESTIAVEAGYAQLLGKGPALYGAVSFLRYAGLRVYVGSDITEVDFFFKGQLDVKLSSVAISPYITFGLGYHDDRTYSSIKSDMGFPLIASAQAGVRFTAAAVPGLYAGAAFQYNLLHLNDNPDPLRMIALVCVGYAF